MSPTPQSVPDLLVVGGGVVGLSIAWRAARRGCRVCVLDRGRVGGGTSAHAAGMLAPVAELAPGEQPVLDLGLRSAARYPSFVAELSQDAGDPGVGYITCGTLLVARDGDDAEALRREQALRERLGVPVARLRPSEARRREPGLAPSVRMALHLPEDHALDPRALCDALARAIRARGGAVQEGVEVRALDVGGVTLGDGSRRAAGAVVLAAGVWSGELGDGFPLRPVKGQIMRLHDPAGPGLITHVVRMGPAYVVPRGDGRYVIGASSEERGFDQTVTAGALFTLLRDASELVPGVSELVLDEITAGLRPGTADNLPAIGRAADGVWWAAGHLRGGVLLAPATAELLLDALLEDRVDPLLAAFSPDRARVGVGS